MHAGAIIARELVNLFLRKKMNESARPAINMAPPHTALFMSTIPAYLPWPVRNTYAPAAIPSAMARSARCEPLAHFTTALDPDPASPSQNAPTITLTGINIGNIYVGSFVLEMEKNTKNTATHNNRME